MNNYIDWAAGVEDLVAQWRAKLTYYLLTGDTRRAAYCHRMIEILTQK